MSVGQIIGGVAGAVVGFVVGGPYGAFVGAAVGFGIGTLVDPITPDITRPDTQDLSVPYATEGIPIPDVIGTTQLSNALNFIWYANPHSVEETEDVGGKGGGGEAVTGYKYYLSFALGICLGPVDAIYSIYDGNELIWTSGASPITIDDATNGHVTLTVTNRGTIDFYFGTDDQVANALVTANTGYAIPWRGLCYAVFNDFMIGNYNRVGSMRFIIRKYPQETYGAYYAIGDYDCNPIYAVKDICERLNIGSLFDDTEAAAVAAVIDGEGLGVSGLYSGERPGIDFLDNIFFHIRACLRTSEDGLLQPFLMRADVDTGDMIEISDDDILDEIDINRPSAGSLDNQVSAKYTKVASD